MYPFICVHIQDTGIFMYRFTCVNCTLYVFAHVCTVHCCTNTDIGIFLYRITCVQTQDIGIFMYRFTCVTCTLYVYKIFAHVCTVHFCTNTDIGIFMYRITWYKHKILVYLCTVLPD